DPFVEARTYLSSLNIGVAWWDTTSHSPSFLSNTFVTKASKLRVLPSLRKSSTHSTPTAHATLPLVRTWDSAKAIVMRSTWPKRISQALLTPSQPTTTFVLSGPMNVA